MELPDWKIHVFWNRSKRVSGLPASSISVTRGSDECLSLSAFSSVSLARCSDEYSLLTFLKESSYEVSTMQSSCWSFDRTFSSRWWNEPLEEHGDKVTVAISSIVDPREHVDLVVIERKAASRLDLSFTLLHQLWSDSRTLSATRAFPHREPICDQKFMQIKGHLGLHVTIPRLVQVHCNTWNALKDR